MVAAILLEIPELELNEDQSDKLAKAAARVMRHYPVGVGEKVADWVNLGMALTGTYGSMARKYRARLKTGKKAVATPQASAAAAPPQYGPTGQATQSGSVLTGFIPDLSGAGA